MSFLPDRRGVSEVLGAILVFGLVLSVLSAVQVAGVPAANRQVEFDHNARVQSDLQNLDNGIDQAGTLGTESAVSVETGVRYPSRLFLLNPGPTAGTISTQPADQLIISNVEALNAETGEYVDAGLTYDTQVLGYEPSYNEYGNAPTTRYEHGVLYNTDDESGISVFDTGGIVSGRRISLVALEGDLSESSTRSINVRAVPISAPATTVSVTDNGSPITLQVYTDLSAEEWRTRVLADEYPSNPSAGRYVSDITCAGKAATEPCNGLITITLEQGVTYDLRLSKVGLGSGFTEEGVAYVTVADDFDTSIPTSGGVVQAVARDRFNNPVSGVPITFASTDGEFDGFPTTTVLTDAHGVASASFTPDANIESATVNAGIDETPAGGNDAVTDEAPEKFVSYELTVVTRTTDYSASEINPDENAGTFVYTDAVIYSGSAFMSEVAFENAGDTKEVTDLRVSFYSPIGDSGHPKTVQTDVFLRYPSALDGKQSTVGGDFIDFGAQDVSVASGDTACFRLEFVDDVNVGDLYGVTLVFDDGSRARYFIQPTETGSLCSTIPAANAGGPYTVAEGNSVALDGSGSADDGSIVSYDWTISNDPTGGASITDANAATPSATFNAPSVTADETVTVRLTVTDDDGNQASQTTTVTVTDGGGGATEPVINQFTGLTADKQSDEIAVGTLQVSDPDGNLDTVDVTVTRDGTSTVVASRTITVTGSSASLSPTLTASEDVRQNDVFDVRVVVTDADGQTATQTKQVTAN